VGYCCIVGHEAVAPLLVKSLTHLEYRGYDSCGVATFSARGIEIRKDVGGVTEVTELQGLADIQGHIGIAHARWGLVRKSPTTPEL
jgi:glutamine---fructose-6-phosphate transaminase (isomerizing)